MREKNVLIIVIAIILLCVIGIGAYVSIQPNYKNITMSQMTLEVPESNVIVTNCSENYNIYNDTKNNLTIRSWSAKIANDPLDTNASEEIGLQAGEILESTPHTTTYQYLIKVEHTPTLILIWKNVV